MTGALDRRAARSRRRAEPRPGRHRAAHQPRHHLHRDDFARFIHTATSITDGTTLLAWIDLAAAVSAQHDAQLPLSGGEQRIPTLAASIAADLPVSLGHTLPALDNHNLELLTTPIPHAAGHPPAPR